jgi:two-component system sensor histidine kinase MtrB
MRVKRHRWRDSLVWRVTGNSVLLCLGIIWLVGSALFSQISIGIFNEKLSNSLSDTDSSTRSITVQLAIAQFQNDLAAKTMVDQLISDAAISGNNAGREVALLHYPTNKVVKNNYERTSNLLSTASVPDSLRKKVRNTHKVQWSRTEIRYLGGKVDHGIVAGSKIEIPRSGTYELYFLYDLATQDRTLNLIRNSLWITGFALILLIGLVTWLVIRQVVNPVREAAEIAEQLSAGDLGRRMEVHGENEIARLAVSFNEMAVSMQRQISRLENLSRLQQRFVSDVSHELRTPLTTIRMASEVIYAKRSSFPPSIARSSELLVSQIERFDSLLADLLEVSRFDAEAAVMVVQPVDIGQLLRRTVDYLHPGRDRMIKLFLPFGSVTADVDSRRIERIFRNLITNAIDHADGKPVEITLAETEDCVAIGVRDYGIGFQEKDSDRLFDRFWRADPSRARSRGGTGLGLSIALEDAKLHQGTLEAWGRLRRGAHFVLTLPKVSGGELHSHPIPVIPVSELSPIVDNANDEEL